MKNERKFQYRYLEKVIQNVELANGLAQTLGSLSRRDLKISVTTLMEKGYELPFSMKLAVTKRVMVFHLQDLLEDMKIKDVTERVKKQQPVIEKVVRVLAAWRCHETLEGHAPWTFALPSFACLSSEHLERVTDMAMDLESAGEAEEKEARDAAMNEAAVRLDYFLVVVNFVLGC